MRLPDINDREYLIYNGYDNGELSRIIHMVSRIDSNSGITMYIDWTNLNEKVKKLPAEYSEFQRKFVFSSKYHTLTSSRDYWFRTAKSEGKKGLVGIDLDIDIAGLHAIFVKYNWDGETLKKKTSRIDLKKGYSYWDMTSFALIGMRFFEPEKGGIAYLVDADFANEIPVSFRYYGDETVNVPAGSFNTKKYGFVITDPFLNGLLGKQAEEYYIWVDKKQQGLMIQSIRPGGQVNKLAKIGIWQREAEDGDLLNRRDILAANGICPQGRAGSNRSPFTNRQVQPL